MRFKQFLILFFCIVPFFLTKPDRTHAQGLAQVAAYQSDSTVRGRKSKKARIRVLRRKIRRTEKKVLRTQKDLSLYLLAESLEGWQEKHKVKLERRERKLTRRLAKLKHRLDFLLHGISQGEPPQPLPTSNPSTTPVPDPSNTPTFHPTTEPTPVESSTPTPIETAIPTPSGGLIEARIETTSSGSCIAPCAIAFDGRSSIHRDSSIDPFHDLAYSWDFGDEKNGTWRLSGRSKNRQGGAKAIHVYESPGVYSVLLVVFDHLGNVGTTTTTVSVLDPNSVFSGSQTRCVSTSGSFSNCPAQAQEVTSTDLSEQFNWLNSDSSRRLLLRAGEHWTTTSTLSISAQGPVLVGTYGTDNDSRAVIRASGTDFAALEIDTNDVAVSSLQIFGGEASNPAAWNLSAVQIQRPLSDILVHRLHVQYFQDGVGNAWSTATTKLFFIDNTISNIQENGMYVGARRLYLAGNDVGHITTSHAVRVYQLQEEGVIQHNFFHDPGASSGRLSLKLHIDVALIEREGSPSDSARNFHIGYNTFGGNRWAVALAPQDPISNERVQDGIFENNTIVGPGTQRALILVAQDLTVRNNIFVADNSSAYYTAIYIMDYEVAPPTGNIRLINNTVVRSEDLRSEYTEFEFVRIQGSRIYDIEFVNNLVHYPFPATGFNRMLSLESPDLIDQLTAHHNMTDTPVTEWVYVNGVGNYSLANWQALSKGVSSSSVSSTSLKDILNNDYSLLSSSPARDAGINLDYSLMDFYDVLRPNGSTTDIGAIEFLQ